MWAVKQPLYAPHLRDIIRALNIPSWNSKFSQGTHICFGRKGSLRICVKGPKAGLFYDFENGAGGTILDLIRRQRGCSWFEARSFADAFTNEESVALGKEITSGVSSDDSSDDILSSSGNVRPLVLNSTALINSPNHVGMRYIREKRKIDTTSFKIHTDIRVIPAHIIPGQDSPALFSCARRVNSNSDKDITGGQVIFLNKNGDKAPDQPTPKKSVGKISGSFVCTQRGENNREIVFLAEGVETALSIAQSFPNQCSIFASLGLFNIKNFRDFAHSNKRTSTIILCEDHDKSNNTATIDEAYRILVEDFDVHRAKPEKPGEDFNDVLQLYGAHKVRERFRHIDEPNLVAFMDDQDKKLKQC